MTEDLLTVEEVAALLRVTKRWVYEASRAETIPSTRVGKFLRFNRTDVEAYLSARRIG